MEDLVWDDQLSVIAREHSQDMAINQYISHNNPAGEDPIPGVTAERLVSLIEEFGHRDVTFAADFAAAEELLGARLEPGDMLLTLGAGDVWKVGERVLATGRGQDSASRGEAPGG